jgi:hypothetical protein
MIDEQYDSIIACVRDTYPNSKMTLIAAGVRPKPADMLPLRVPSKYSWASIKDYFRALFSRGRAN